MKKNVLNFVVLAIVALLVPGRSLAYDFSSVTSSGDTVYYDIVAGGVQVTRPVVINDSWTGCTNLVIPSSVEHNGVTYDVISIGGSAFRRCTSLISVIIPNSVTSIGPNAFEECTSLTSVVLPDNITEINAGLFRRCTSLTSIVIPDGVTRIGYNSNFGDSFAECTSLTSVSIPNSVTYISTRSFYGCTSLVSITIPDSVSYIDNGAFYGVKNVVYHGSATGSPWGALSINGVVDGDFVFADSTKTLLSVYIGNGGNVTIPSTVDTIGDYAFAFFSRPISVTIPSSVNAIGTGGIDPYNMYESRGTFYNCTGLTSVVIPSSITMINDGTFFGCTGLTSVTIPNSVTSIGRNAFRGCTNLTSVNISTGITTISGGTFMGCTGLTSVSIPNGVECIGEKNMYSGRGAFEGCTSLASVTIPSSVTFIGVYAFEGCKGLASVNIPGSVDTIGQEAFAGCTGLAPVSIPDSVTFIGYDAFSLVKSIFYHGSATGSPWGALSLNGEIDGDFVFTDSTKTYLVAYVGNGGSVTIPSTVDTIGVSAFYECDGLTSVTIPNSVTSIGWSAFQGCTGLTSVTIPNSVTSIEGGAFRGCTSLTSINFPGSITYIGPNAFDSCINLSSVYSYATVPPSINVYSSFRFVSKTIPLFVPCEAVSEYSSSAWSTIFYNIYCFPFPDTVFVSVHDTIYIEDIVYIHDTIYIYDTVYITQEGIGDVEAISAKIYQRDGQIVVEGANGNTVLFYDVNGRMLATKRDEYAPLRFDAPVSGTYMIKIGNHPARKMVVVR